MQKSHLLIQLVFNGRAVWQVRQNVSPEICRKMTQEELKAFGEATAHSLGTIIREANPLTSGVAVTGPVSVSKKKR
jgi:hypothetical protein